MSDGGPEVLDLAKVGGGLGAGGVLTLLLSRLLKGEDKVLARLDRLSEEVHGITTKLAVLVAASERRDNDIAALQSQVQAHQRTLSGLQAIVATLGHKVPSNDGG